MGVPEALHAIADYGATDLAKRLTPDPAGVSPAIKVLLARDLVVKRLNALATAMAKAIESDDDDEVQDLVASAFPNYIDPASPTSKSTISASLPRPPALHVASRRSRRESLGARRSPRLPHRSHRRPSLPRGVLARPTIGAVRILASRAKRWGMLRCGRTRRRSTGPCEGRLRRRIVHPIGLAATRGDPRRCASAPPRPSPLSR